MKNKKWIIMSCKGCGFVTTNPKTMKIHMLNCPEFTQEAFEEVIE